MFTLGFSKSIHVFPDVRIMFMKSLSTRMVVLTGALVLALSGCGSKESETRFTQSAPSPVVAYVNDETITQADVDFMLQRMLKGQAFAQVDDALRKKILDSLISSRAMKIQMELLLTPEEIEEINRSADAYKEELYVKEYLAKNVVPEPVTLEMVQTYYDIFLID